MELRLKKQLDSDPMPLELIPFSADLLVDSQLPSDSDI